MVWSVLSSIGSDAAADLLQFKLLLFLLIYYQVFAESVACFPLILIHELPLVSNVLESW